MKNWCFIFALLFAVSASAQPLLIDEEAAPAAEDGGKPAMLSAETGENAENGAEAAPAEGEPAAEENTDETPLRKSLSRSRWNIFRIRVIFRRIL